MYDVSNLKPVRNELQAATKFGGVGLIQTVVLLLDVSLSQIQMAHNSTIGAYGHVHLLVSL